MKTDLYLKAVLTLIACCLAWLSVRDFVVARPVEAQISRVPIRYTDKDPMPVKIVAPTDYVDGTLVVKVTTK
jgi:hypothetical protein